MRLFSSFFATNEGVRIISLLGKLSFSIKATRVRSYYVQEVMSLPLPRKNLLCSEIFYEGRSKD